MLIKNKLIIYKYSHLDTVRFLTNPHFCLLSLSIIAKKQHSLLIRSSVANQARHLSRRLLILTFYKHWSYKAIVQRQGCDSSVLCFLLFFYPHETKQHLHLPLWCTSVNPRVSWSHKQITPSRGLVTPVRLSSSPPHSCFKFGGRQTGGIRFTRSAFLFAGMIRIRCRDWVWKPQSLSCQDSALTIRGTSGINRNIRQSLQVRFGGFQLSVVGRKRHQMNRIRRTTQIHSNHFRARWELIKRQDIYRWMGVICHRIL